MGREPGWRRSRGLESVQLVTRRNVVFVLLHLKWTTKDLPCRAGSSAQWHVAAEWEGIWWENGYVGLPGWC